LTRFVVDASVAIKWVVSEIYSEAAARLLGEDMELWVPDLIWSELGSIVWKKWRRGELEEELAPVLLQTLRRIPFQVESSKELQEGAWQVARDFDRSFYDSLYLALAVRKGCPMVTADRRLYNALQGAQLPILWIEDLP
jgi:predicted nucleic acid-binding protein